MKVPESIEPLCRAFVDGLKTVLGEKLYRVVLYGALAFPETTATFDLDGHVVVTEPLTEVEKAGVRDLHASLARDHTLPGGDLDVYYLRLTETRGRTPPVHQLDPGIVDDSWALHRAHIRAGRCFVLYGTDPAQDYAEPSWEELEAALEAELTFVESHLTDYPAYCTLNLCRLVYSYETHDVVISKAGAAAWAWQVFPEWRPLIEAAQRFYAGKATAQEEALMRPEMPALLYFALERIRRARCEGRPRVGEDG